MHLRLKRENIWLVLVGLTLSSFAFSERINSWGIILICIFTLADKDLIQKIKRANEQYRIFPMLAFFIVYLLFYLFSEKDSNASHTLIVKLSFFLLPLAFYIENYFTLKNERLILNIFSIAIGLGFLYQLSNSFMDYYFLAEEPKLSYALNRMLVSQYIMHPGYYSVFLMFGIIWHFFNKGPFRLSYILLFSIGVIILISRVVILFYIIFLIYLSIRFILTRKNKALTTMVFIAFGVVSTFLLYQIPTIRYRVNTTFQNINNTSKDNSISSATASRRIAYEYEIKLVAKKPIAGYGLGNATETLRKELQLQGYNELSKEMNTHCQYINTWMQTGILGLLTLLFLLLFLLNLFKKENKQTALWFVILIGSCLLTDDLLEIQANGVFFVLLLSLYIQKRPTSSP